jgi:hypothetical protein
MGVRRSAPLAFTAAALVMWLAGLSSVSAEPIRLTTSGASFTAESDTVTLIPSIFSLSLEPLPTGTVNFDEGGTFQVGISPSVSPPHALTLTQLITIGDVSRLVTQTGELSITPSIDTLSIFATPAIPFTLGSRGTVFLTFHRVTQSTRVTGQFPFTITGTLSTTAPIPEPGSLILLGTGVAVVLFRGRGRIRSRLTRSLPSDSADSH